MASLSVSFSAKETPAHATSIQSSFQSTDEEVIGFVDDAEAIIQKLSGGIKQFDIVSIVGMPGLGKTTLARKIFNYYIDHKYFDVRAWVSLSKEYSLSKVFSEILKQVVGYMDGVSDESMPDKLRKSLMRKRYLIVLDDIWEVKAWEDLRLCFPRDENGSRVLVTTRDEEVARELKHHSSPYILRFLTTNESWKLLEKKVFQGDICPPKLHKAGLQVAKNCKRLPLVIVLTAGIIRKKREVSLWLEVANDLSSHVLEEQSMKIIESSYDHLGDHLKACLLYMGLFPEDYRFLVSDLHKLWIAENFVKNTDDTDNLEETSKTFLNDLVTKSLVMVSKRRDNGEIKYCTIHDVVHEFCLRKLTTYKFLQVVVPCQPLEAKEPQLCMCVHDDLVEALEGLKERESFSQRHDRSVEYQISVLPLLGYFRGIRVLNLLNIHLESWATAMQAVTHLRHLAIWTEEFDFQWVSHLLDLQTLRVVPSGLAAMPLKTSPSVWKMQKLRHLDIYEFSFIWEDNDRAVFEESSELVLSNLKTFGKCCINLADLTPEFWWRFPHIEELKLHFIEPKEYVPTEYSVLTPEVHIPNLEELPLQSLRVGFSNIWGSIGRGSCVVFPSNLKELSLHSIYLTENLVSNFTGLQNLERLTLREIYFAGSAWPCWDVSAYRFQTLKYLKLRRFFAGLCCSSEESFPVLEKLVLYDCHDISNIPSSFVDIPTLKLIKLHGGHSSLAGSAWNIKKEIEEVTGCDRLHVHVQRYVGDSGK